MNYAGLQGGFTQSRKKFYLDFLQFAHRHPEMRVFLYIPSSDLNLLASEECFSIAASLSDLCLSGRLALTREMPRLDLLDTLRALRNDRSASGVRRGIKDESSTGFHPNAA